MRRRDFIRLIGGSAALPMPLSAQVLIRPLIAMLLPISAAAATRNVAAFRSALRDLGYVDGRNMTIELRYGDGAPERMALLARELVALSPDVILAGALSGAAAVRDATQIMPIVTITPENPIASKFAQSIAKPGGNITGLWSLGDDALVGKRLDFLKLAAPNVSRVGVLLNSDDPTDSVLISRLPAAAGALGLAIQSIEVRNASKLDAVADEVTRTGVNALLVGQGPTLNSARASVTAMVMRLKLPAVYGWREFAEVGGLMSYGPNLPDLYRQAARLVGRILKGEKAGDLPFELPTRYELIVNLKTAKAMGLTLPNAFVLLADEVIE